MQKNYRVWLMAIIITLAAGGQTYAALPPRARHTAENPVPVANSRNTIATETDDDDDAPGGHSGHHSSGHHSSGHHGGGHHGGGGHYHVSHSHHSYHSPRGHHHHYAEHYHHYHHHYHSYHGGWLWGSDFAGLSIVCDIFGLSVFGILFGAIGLGIGRRRGLARAGLVIGIIELILEVAILVAIGVL